MKKGQAAIEFLITYGWAIMAAIVAIGALTYFGMTNPSSSLPDKCVFSNAFGCKDQYLNSTAIKVRLTNTNGETLYGYTNATGLPSNLTALITDTTTNCTVTLVGTALPTGAVNPEDVIEVICNGIPGAPYAKGDKAKVKISVYYANKPLGYTQVSLGDVYTTVQ